MFGARVKYGIAFKTNEPNFDIFTRKCYHNFKVCIDNQSYEGAVGKELFKSSSYVMADDLGIGIYDNSSFQRKSNWTVKAKSEGVEILYLEISSDETKIGVIVGKQLIKDKCKITEIVIYSKE